MAVESSTLKQASLSYGPYCLEITGAKHLWTQVISSHRFHQLSCFQNSLMSALQCLQAQQFTGLRSVILSLQPVPSSPNGLCSRSLFPNHLFGIRKHFPIGTILWTVVFHTCLVEPQRTWNVALTVLYPQAIIYSASLGKCILSFNLGCLKLTSPSAWQPLL